MYLQSGSIKFKPVFFSPSVTILNKFAKSAHENLKKLRNGLGQKLFFKWDNPEDKFSHNT
jgi:hypothetical protein